MPSLLSRCTIQKHYMRVVNLPNIITYNNQGVHKLDRVYLKGVWLTVVFIY